jgi:hypothetical protein
MRPATEVRPSDSPRATADAYVNDSAPADAVGAVRRRAARTWKARFLESQIAIGSPSPESDLGVLTASPKASG